MLAAVDDTYLFDYDGTVHGNLLLALVTRRRFLLLLFTSLVFSVFRRPTTKYKNKRQKAAV